jgi:5'-deoxynucleotidase YfbR-like HD superfamily hydrolase
MEDLIEFFLKAGEVKRLKQRGLVLRGVEDPARIGGHSFREALMGWVLTKAGDTGLDSSRVIKIVLLRDLASGYGGDPTPYEPLIWKNENSDNMEKVFQKWVRLSKDEKQKFVEQKIAQQTKGFEQLVTHLPPYVATEMKNLWTEYTQQLTQEARFVHQLHMMENFIQSLEYWKKNKDFPMESWWHQMKELVSHPLLVELLKKLDDKFYGKHN